MSTQKKIPFLGCMAGFTLVEMLTVFTILIIIGYSLALLFNQATHSYAQIKASQEIVDTERAIITTITRDIENAYLSQTNPLFRFIGSNTALHFNAFQTDENGVVQIVEIGYSYDAAQKKILRRVQTAGVPDADVTVGGIVEDLGAHINSLDFRIGYRFTGNTIRYLVSGSGWDSQTNTYANYDSANQPKDPDGLPHVIEVSFSLTDSKGFYTQQTVTTKIYVTQNK